MAEAATATYSEIVKSSKSLKGLKSLNFCVTAGSKFFVRVDGLKRPHSLYYNPNLTRAGENYGLDLS